MRRYEILWDGNTVWVNTVSCIARFGKMQGELYYSGKNSGDCVSKETFIAWKQRVLDTFGIEVPMVAMPLWSLAQSMETPIRCGGLDYCSCGKARYRHEICDYKGNEDV